MDRRTTPATARVALARLRGMIDRPAFTEGRPARVAVPLADLCRAPGGARDRQIMFGVDVTVIDTEDGWSFVEAEDDYCGWVADAALTDSQPPVTHRVSAPSTHVYREPDIKRGEVMALPLGARLAGVGKEKRFLRLASGGFVPLLHVSERPAVDPVAVAESLLRTPYLWGGNSRWGIDCSGLVQVSLHACGISCPCDSDQQFADLGEPVDDAPRRGDLVFWSGHVAMVVGPDRIIHANGHDMAVTFDGLRKVRARINAAGEGAFLGLRRIRD